LTAGSSLIRRESAPFIPDRLVINLSFDVNIW